MKILGIETSCDETAAAIVTDQREILSNVIRSQIQEHTPYGGVVPEIASRSHIEHIEGIVQQALEEANTRLSELDAIAVTSGPGLIGGLITGVMVAKAMASAAKKTFIAVNHLEGHALTVRLTNNVEFPFLLLLVSGGHCQILYVRGVGEYIKLGSTLDDALGEAFDKTAKMLGLGYPGGPAVEARARKGDNQRWVFPRPLLGREGCDFSFSGLKTAVYREVEALKASDGLDDVAVDDICASFQRCCGDILLDRLEHAISQCHARNYPVGSLVIAGGVAANQYLNGRLKALESKYNLALVSPPLALCTDNAAMIAWAGLEQLKCGNSHSLDAAPRARWPLDS